MMSRGTVCRSWEMWFVSLFVLVAAFAVMAFAPGKAEAATGTTSYRYTSEPGDYIGARDRTSTRRLIRAFRFRARAPT